MIVPHRSYTTDGDTTPPCWPRRRPRPRRSSLWPSRSMQPKPDHQAARGLPGAGQDPDRGAGRRGGQLWFQGRVQCHCEADDHGSAAKSV